MDTHIENNEHYVCLGGCRGVSSKPGVCQAPNCEDHNHALVPCNCTDGEHFNFKQQDEIVDEEEEE